MQMGLGTVQPEQGPARVPADEEALPRRVGLPQSHIGCVRDGYRSGPVSRPLVGPSSRRPSEGLDARSFPCELDRRKGARREILIDRRAQQGASGPGLRPARRRAGPRHKRDAPPGRNRRGKCRRGQQKLPEDNEAPSGAAVHRNGELTLTVARTCRRNPRSVRLCR